MSKRKFITALFTLAVLYIIFSGSSGGRASVANSGNTGAPGETQGCASCHGGGGFGTVTPRIRVFQSGTSIPVISYIPGVIYDISVTVETTAGSPSGYGFQMTALTASSNAPISGYTSLASNVKQKTITFSGRTYVEHNGVGTNNVFNMKWTAPVAGTGNIKFYAAGNAVNRNNNTTGDKSGTAGITLNEAPPFSVTGVVSEIVCHGGDDGGIDVTPAGGTAPYSYSWDDGSVTQDRLSLAAGTYSVTITDNTGSTAAGSFTVTQPGMITLGVTANGDAGASVGFIDLNVSGGTPPYSFLWSNGTTTEDINQLPAGDYTVVITDANGCLFSQTITVQGATSAAHANDIEAKLYPNPFSENIQIIIGADVSALKVSVYDVSGRIVKRFEFAPSSKPVMLDLHDLKPSVYLLRITSGEKYFMQRVVKH